MGPVRRDSDAHGTLTDGLFHCKFHENAPFLMVLMIPSPVGIVHPLVILHRKNARTEGDSEEYLWIFSETCGILTVAKKDNHVLNEV